MKELKIKDIPKFSGDFDDWIDWNNHAKDALSNNRWLGTANKVGELNDNEKAISNSIFYQLAFATKESSIAMLVEKFRPKSRSTKLAEGHKAWQEIVKYFDHERNRRNIADSIESKLNNLSVTKQSTLNVPGYINRFNYLYKQLLEYDDENGYSRRKLLRQFTDGILDKSYLILKRQPT